MNGRPVTAGSTDERQAHRSWRPRARQLLVIACTAMAACAGGNAGPEVTEPTPWPTTEWSRSAPGDAGVDGAALEALGAKLAAGAYGNVDAVMVVRHGRVVADLRYDHDYVAANAGYPQEPHHYNYYNPAYHPFREGSEVHTIQSITKSVTSALIGIAIHRGEIESTEVAVLPLLTDWEVDDPDGLKATITLEDVLSMRPGFEWEEFTLPYTDTGNDAAQLEASDDWLQFLLDKPMAATPGETFVYNSGNSMIMSALIQGASGMSTAEYAEQHLFGPLGISEYYWKMTPGGLQDTEGGLYLRTEDLAKIGYLYLHDGIWEDERMLPEGWVERSARPWVSFATPDSTRGYGFQWWITDDGSGDSPMLYGGSGYGGQLLLIAPELDLVAVVNSWNIYEESYSAAGVIIDHVIPALR